MLEELNNILDRTNNWIVFEEARNSGLIALNLGLISFIFGSNLLLKELLLTLCIIAIMICAYSFVGKKLPTFLKSNHNKINGIESNSINELASTCEEKQKNKDQKDSLFSDSRVVIKRNTGNEALERKDLSEYASKNIYNYKDVAQIDEEILLLLVYQKLLKRNEKEEYPIHISKDYHFKLAHKDLSNMICKNSVLCLVKSKCFFMSLALFVINILVMGVLFFV